MRLVAAVVAVLASLAGGAPPQAKQSPSLCGPIEFGVTTEEELVDRIGPPCWVHLTTSWDAYVSGKTRPASHALRYGRVCAVDCDPPADDCPDPERLPPLVTSSAGSTNFGALLRCTQGYFCHTSSKEAALVGPLGPAGGVTFSIREGRVVGADWEYSREDLLPARAALLKDKAFEVDPSASGLDARHSSPTCQVSVRERNEHSIVAAGYKREP